MVDNARGGNDTLTATNSGDGATSHPHNVIGRLHASLNAKTEEKQMARRAADFGLPGGRATRYMASLRSDGGGEMLDEIEGIVDRED
jgi:hypothetical protein